MVDLKESHPRGMGTKPAPTLSQPSHFCFLIGLTFIQILNLSTRSPDWIPWVLGRLWSVRRSGLGWAGAPGTVDPRTCQAQDPPPSHLWLSPS